MARPGVGTEKIIQVIREVEAAGREPTATSVRERLGSGSYTTIAAVLADLRREKASQMRAEIPEPPEGLRHLFTQLWAEAWKAALNVHEPERQAFARARAEHGQITSEMAAEIARLEGDSTLAITALSVANCPRDCCHLLRGRACPPEAGPLAAGKYQQVVVGRGPARFQASHRDRRRRPGSDPIIP